MRIISTVKDMQDVARKVKASGKTIGLVPTMGFLHEGHLSLIRRSKEECGFSVVSIYVNPAQFGPQEDFGKYPRDFRRDEAACRKLGVDAIFYPDDNQMYPPRHLTYVDVPHLGGMLCGKSRPTHFKGVTTIVAKLFNIIEPHRAYFGKKDYQQCVIIRRMASDLHFPIDVLLCDTVREPDGLAMSSRNAYLSQGERASAVIISRALTMARELYNGGIRNFTEIDTNMRRAIIAHKGVRIDYIAGVDKETLAPKEVLDEGSVILIAAYVGKTRLIDNIELP